MAEEIINNTEQEEIVDSTQTTEESVVTEETSTEETTQEETSSTEETTSEETTTDGETSEETSEEGEGEGDEDVDPEPEPEPEPEPQRVFIALTKNRGKSKILVTSMEGYESGYTIDGIYVTDGTNAVILSASENEVVFGGTSVDLEENDPLYNIPSPSMSSFDGEWRTDWLISFFGYTEGALVEAKDYGWLPSGGEMALIASKKEEINAMLTLISGTQLSDNPYWTSQKFSNDRMWSCEMSENKFTVNYGCVDALSVRPVKSAEGYAVAE